jgi:hypothetical protein
VCSIACVTSSPTREPEPTRDVEPQSTEVVVAEPVVFSPTAPTPAPAAIPNATAEPTVTGIAVCDEYLALYQSCEEYLKPEIMAGNRRFHHAEQASLQYYAGTPEAAQLPASCRNMLDALRADCPPEHRQPPKP